MVHIQTVLVVNVVSVSSFTDPNNMFSGSTCPFAQKQYKTTYSLSQGALECVGDSQSVITVSGNTIIIETCALANLYGTTLDYYFRY